MATDILNFDEEVKHSEDALMARTQELQNLLQRGSVSQSALKKAKENVSNARVQLEKCIDTLDKQLVRSSINELWDLESQKDITPQGTLELSGSLTQRVKELYELIIHTNTQYQKIPIANLNHGYMCGLVEDLVTVLRTMSCLQISNKHIISIPDLINGFRHYVEREPETGQYRFLFFSDFIARNIGESDKFFSNMLCIRGSYRRIGRCYAQTDRREIHMYAIRGLKGIEPDPRVTERIMYCDHQYAVCFLNPDDAKAISLYKDQNEKVAIYCDAGAINANTDIIHINGHFFASQELKRNHCTMIPCLSGSVSQQKRMSGLIIDIRMLLDLFASIGGKVLRDELGSLQIYGDIPWHCVVALLEDDEMSRFWEGVPVEEESESDGYDSCDEYYRQYNHYDDDH